MRSDSGEDGSRVTSVLGLRLGLDASHVRSRLDSLGVGALSGGNVFGRSNRLGDSLGFLYLDSLGNTRWSALGRLGSTLGGLWSVTVTMTECSSVDGLGEW
jgi:hypothetical protein